MNLTDVLQYWKNEVRGLEYDLRMIQETAKAVTVSITIAFELKHRREKLEKAREILGSLLERLENENGG